MAEAAKSGILGVGKYLPERILTNSDLERMVETSDEWITTRTGIKERRIAGENETTSDLATKAARNAIEDAGLQVSDIDMIIVATITSDNLFPSTSCMVQSKLGAGTIPAFDVSAACSGFVYGLAVADQFVKGGLCKHPLVIAAEKMSTIVNWEDRGTCVLFGDGAGAVVLGPVEEGGILGVHLGADGVNGQLLKMKSVGSYDSGLARQAAREPDTIFMEGNALFKHAVKLMADAAVAVIEPLGLKGEDISLIVPHQANIRILNMVAKRLGVNPDEKLFLNIEKYGNMSAASSAVAFAEAVEEGRIKKGDVVLLDAFGGGLTWGAMAIQW